MIVEQKDYEWVEPVRGKYTNSNYHIIFAKMKDHLKYQSTGNDMIRWNDPAFRKNFDILKAFRIRVFENENVIIDFDYKTQNVKLKFYEAE
ncbi:MAG: hypothetical protein K9H84_03130 [Bacteroidales bacterium]|nr:hypothetical protein [Bacteroidales bacterium]